MHEASLMESALDLAREQTWAAGGSRIHRIRLRVGEMSGVVPEALEFAFEALSPHGPAEGAVLEIESVPARHRCETCQREFGGMDPTPQCPYCGGWSVGLKSGLELELVSVEIS